jgi:hypothetical protein
VAGWVSAWITSVLSHGPHGTLRPNRVSNWWMIVIRMPIVLAISWGVTGRNEAAASPPILTVGDGPAELGQDTAGEFGEVHGAAAADEDVSVCLMVTRMILLIRVRNSHLGIGPSRSRGPVLLANPSNGNLHPCRPIAKGEGWPPSKARSASSPTHVRGEQTVRPGRLCSDVLDEVTEPRAVK